MHCEWESTASWDRVDFDSDDGEDFRIKQRKPKNNEVWVSKDWRVFVRNDNVDKMISLDGVVDLGEMITMKYCAPTPESYYARKFYEQSMTKDCGFDYEDARKCIDVLKEACRYED